MSTALLGLLLIQAYWINWSVKLSKEKVQRNLFDALQEAADRHRQKELRNTIVDFVQKYQQSDRQLIDENLYENPSDLIDQLVKEAKKNPKATYNLALLESELVNLSRKPLAERIDIESLSNFIQQELQNHGIQSEYEYAVLNFNSTSAVVLNGYFVYEGEEQLHQYSENIESIFNSPFRVELFKDADRLESSGFLVIYLKKAGSEVLDNVWVTLVGSLIFTGLILFCFIYAYQIIFKQKKLSEMKSDFINNMTHEFKTPIATINLAAESIQSQKVINSPSEIRRLVSIISQENKRMLSQVEQVLKIAQMEHEVLNLKFEKLSLHKIIEEILNQISFRVEQLQGTIKLELSASQETIEGDRIHLENVVHNLLDNAIKYSPEKPKIEIYTHNVNNTIVLEVRDHGIGISKDQKKYIFDKFYRVPTGNIHDVKGFGLGLSYVKSIVEAHRGTIDVSAQIGKGSSFFVKFPVSK